MPHQPKWNFMMFFVYFVYWFDYFDNFHLNAWLSSTCKSKWRLIVCVGGNFFYTQHVYMLCYELRLRYAYSPAKQIFIIILSHYTTTVLHYTHEWTECTCWGHVSWVKRECHDMMMTMGRTVDKTMYTSN